MSEILQKKVKSSAQIAVPKARLLPSKSREFVEEYANSEISENEEDDDDDDETNGIRRTGELDSESPMPPQGSA